MNKEEIIEIVKQIGINKGYRIDYPEDWYGGIVSKDIFKKINCKIFYKHFDTINNSIRLCFPNYEFLEWKFLIVSKGFWQEDKNKISYLKWLEKEIQWNAPEDWYNINRKIFIENYGHSFWAKTTVICILKLLYPYYKFDFSRLNKAPNGHWDNFQELQKYLLPKCEAVGRMLVSNEIRCIKGLNGAILKHGGINLVGEKLGFEPTCGFKTLCGHIVKSIPEVILDNFLYLNNIKFEYEKQIVFDKKYLCDFYVNDIFIEIWGYIGKQYEINRNKKLKVYNENYLKLISLESDLFKNNKLFYINKQLIKIFKEHKIKLENFYNEDLSKLGYFESYTKNKVIEEIRQECIKNKFTTMPSRAWWFKSKFRKKIKFLEGKVGMHELADLFGLAHNEKPKQYWMDFDNLKKEILPICEDLKSFPTPNQLTELKRTDIVNAISKYHNGFKVVKIKLGFSLTPINVWKDLDKVKKELALICTNIGQFPT